MGGGLDFSVPQIPLYKMEMAMLQRTSQHLEKVNDCDLKNSGNFGISEEKKMETL